MCSQITRVALIFKFSHVAPLNPTVIHTHSAPPHKRRVLDQKNRAALPENQIGVAGCRPVTESKSNSFPWFCSTHPIRGCPC